MARMLPALPTFTDYFGAPTGQPDNMAAVVPADGQGLATGTNMGPDAMAAVKIVIVLLIIVMLGIGILHYVEKE